MQVNDRKGSLQKKVSGQDQQGTCRKDELIDAKPPVATESLTVTVS
jgi:hypothetical protein